MLKSLYNKIWGKHLWVFFLFILFTLYGCSSSSSDDSSSSTPVSLNVSADDTLLQGSNMAISVSFASPSENSLKVGGSTGSTG